MSQHRFESAQILVIDGQALDGTQPQLLANLPGVLRGEGVFETFLVIDGEPTRLIERHEERLRHSAALLGMDLGEHGLLVDAHEILSVLPKAGRWRVRYTVLRAHDRASLRIWTAGPVSAPPDQVSLLWSRYRQDPGDPLSAAKTISRAKYQVAHAEAIEAGCQEALLPTIDGDVSECSAANLLIWQDGALRTPGLDRGVLPGVTRALLLEGCQKAGIPAFEQKISQKLLCEAEEVFVSNAVIGVIPVDKIKGLREGYPGSAGAMLPRLREAYRAALPHLPPGIPQ
ncbi:MAG: aminotransferase class IV [Planctomycetes bacterium]|nr:aminotransferase class IV [Planctomycetota bacterium]